MPLIFGDDSMEKKWCNIFDKLRKYLDNNKIWFFLLCLFILDIITTTFALKLPGLCESNPNMEIFVQDIFSHIAIKFIGFIAILCPIAIVKYIFIKYGGTKCLQNFLIVVTQIIVLLIIFYYIYVVLQNSILILQKI